MCLLYSHGGLRLADFPDAGALEEYLLSKSCNLKDIKTFSHAALSDLVFHYFDKVSLSTARVKERLKTMIRKKPSKTFRRLPTSLFGSQIKSLLYVSYCYLKDNRKEDNDSAAYEMGLMDGVPNSFFRRHPNIIEAIDELKDNIALKSNTTIVQE